MASRIWPTLCCLDCKRSCPRIDKDFPKHSSARLEMVIVSRRRLLEQSISSNANHSRPARKTWNEREVFSCAGAQDMDTRGYELKDLDDIEFFSEILIPR